MAMINEQQQRDRFGGTNWGAAFFGWLVAIGVGALLTGLLSAIGSAVALTTSTDALTQNATTVGLVSGILLLLALAAAYYAGGYVAGRMSRFDGGRQGVGVWVVSILMMVLLALLAAVFGASYNLLQQMNIPTIPVNSGDLTNAGLITLLLAAAVSLVSAIIGGSAGTRYHRVIDRVGDTAADRPIAAQDEELPRYTRAGRPMPSFGERIERRHRRADDRSTTRHR